MKPRKLKLPSGTWRYLVGDATTLWSPAGKRYRIGAQHLFTTCMCSCPPQFQCFGKGFSPHSLRRFIEKHLLGDMRFAVGNRVETGRRGAEDHDLGYVRAVDGNSVTVRWDDSYPTETTQAADTLRDVDR